MHKVKLDNDLLGKGAQKKLQLWEVFFFQDIRFQDNNQFLLQARVAKAYKTIQLKNLHVKIRLPLLMFFFLLVNSSILIFNAPSSVYKSFNCIVLVLLWRKTSEPFRVKPLKIFKRKQQDVSTNIDLFGHFDGEVIKLCNRILPVLCIHGGALDYKLRRVNYLFLKFEIFKSPHIINCLLMINSLHYNPSLLK